jgi:hypothetical protein
MVILWINPRIIWWLSFLVFPRSLAKIYSNLLNTTGAKEFSSSQSFAKPDGNFAND